MPTRSQTVADITNLGDDRLASHLEERTLTAEEQRNLEAVQRWNETYNGPDPEEFVRSSYHPDIQLVMFDGVGWTGHTEGNKLAGLDLFVEIETYIKNFAPKRRFEVHRAIAAGNQVTVQASLYNDDDPGFELAWITVLTFRDGKIISDHSYLNRMDWPGVAEYLGYR